MRTFILVKPKHSLYELILAIIAAAFIVFNVFAAEMFIYTYMLPFTSAALLLIVMSTYILVKVFNARNILIALALIICSVHLYQGWGALFLPLTLTFLVYKYLNRGFIYIAKKGLVVSVIYLLAGLVNIFYIKVLHRIFNPYVANRTGDNLDIISNLDIILRLQKLLWVSHFKMLPDYVFVGTMVSLICLALFCIFTRIGADIHYKVRLTSFLFIIVVAQVFLSLFPHLLTSNVWLVQRSIMPFSAIPGVLLLFLVLIMDASVNYRKYITVLLVSCFFMVTLAAYTHKIARDNLTVNKLDEELASTIMYHISRHEQETGVVVTKIAAARDKQPTWVYENTISYRDLNCRALVVDWAVAPVLGYVSGRHFNEVDMDTEIYNKYFADRDWDSFSPEQIIVVGDTAYIALY